MASSGKKTFWFKVTWTSDGQSIRSPAWRATRLSFNCEPVEVDLALIVTGCGESAGGGRC